MKSSNYANYFLKKFLKIKPFCVLSVEPQNECAMKNVVFLFLMLLCMVQAQANPRRYGYGKPLYGKPYHEKIYYGKSKAFGYVKVCPACPEVVVIRPACPGPNYVWVEGEWIWNPAANNYMIQEGRWMLPEYGSIWIPGHWKNTRYGWYWVAGHWK